MRTQPTNTSSDPRTLIGRSDLIAAEACVVERTLCGKSVTAIVTSNVDLDRRVRDRVVERDSRTSVAGPRTSKSQSGLAAATDVCKAV
jgi:hypothetical protein